MSEAWNASIVTPDGEPVEFGAGAGTRPYQRKEVLERHIRAGDLTREIAAEYEVHEQTIRRQMKNNGIEPPNFQPELHQGDYATTRRIHEENGLKWGVNVWANDGRGRTRDLNPELTEAIEWALGSHPCPECGAEYLTVEEQHDCLRAHSRGLASHLAGLDEEVLNL